MSLNIPGQHEMIESFKKGIAHPTKGKVDVARARRLKKNKAGSLRMKIRHACPRCQGTMKRNGDEMKCECGYSRYWRRVGFHV